MTAERYFNMGIKIGTYGNNNTMFNVKNKILEPPRIYDLPSHEFLPC